MELELSDTKSTLLQKQTELEELKAKSTANEFGLKDTKEKLSENKNELVKTKQKLVETQNDLKESKGAILANQIELKKLKSKFSEEFGEAGKKMNKHNIKLLETTKEIENVTKSIMELTKNVDFQKKNLYDKQNESIILIHDTTEIISKCLLPIAREFEERNSRDVERKGNHRIKNFENKLNIKLNQSPIVPFTFKNFDFKELNSIIQTITKPPFEKRIEQIFKKMNIGEIYEIDDQQVFFKLQRHKNQKFFINHVIDVRQLQRDCRNYVVHGNDRLILLDFNDHYHLWLQIPKYDENNSQCYLFNTKEGDEKYLLKYDSNDNIQWNKYKSEKNEVLFYLKKK